jgi:hypothetical protein
LDTYLPPRGGVRWFFKEKNIKRWTRKRGGGGNAKENGRKIKIKGKW